MLPENPTAEDVVRELARVPKAPVSKFCFPCPRCSYERQSSQPWVAVGCYTAEGLKKHLFECHGEVE